MKVRRVVARFVVAALIAAGGIAAVATPASANGGYHSSCALYDICYYWDDSPAFTGSKVGLWGVVDDHMNPWITFQTAGYGQGQGLGNNAGSIENKDYQSGACVFYDPYEQGPSNWMAASGSLGGNGWFVTQNNNRSSYGGASSC